VNVVTPELKAQAVAWLYQYGPVGCVALVLAACVSTARRPRGPRR